MRDVGVECAEERRGDVDSRDDYRLAAVHFGGEPRIRGDGGIRSDVASGAEILGQHAAYEIVEIEVCRKRHGTAFSAPLPAPQCCASGRPANGSVERRLGSKLLPVQALTVMVASSACVDVDRIEALLLLADPGRGRGSGLDHEHAAGPSNQIARVLARGMVRVAREQHIDT